MRYEKGGARNRVFLHKCLKGGEEVEAGTFGSVCEPLVLVSVAQLLLFSSFF